MTLPFALPDWLPWWVPLYALALLLMPFSVIGVKGRLDVIEARLDEIQGEIRSLALRLREPGAAEYHPADFEEVYAPRADDSARRASQISPRPPIPPAAQAREARAPRAPGSGGRAPRREAPRDAPRGGRSEPRIDWPR